MQKPNSGRARRGRPKNEKLTAPDLAIALTVYHLSLWGFPLPRVLEVVGKIALEVLGRHGLYDDIPKDAKPPPLTKDRIAQIFDRWRKAERARRHWQTGGSEMALLERKRFSKRSL